MKYFVIGDEDSVLGFGMVGVKGRSVSGADQASAAFEEAISLPEIGIIIISEDAASLIRETVNRYIFTREFPLIVEIPGSRGRNPDRPGLRQMVNEAIGINL